jgi:hypothetical protein
METDAEYLNRTLAVDITKLLNQIAADEGLIAPVKSSRQPRIYSETFHPYKGEGRNTYMIRHTRIKDDTGVMAAALYRKRGKEWNRLDYCEAKTRKVIDRKIRTWKNRYEA